MSWPLLLVPAAAFIPSFVDAIKLHHTTDGAELTRLWRRSLLLAVIGMVLVIAAALIVERIKSV